MKQRILLPVQPSPPFYFLQMALILALSLVPLLAVTATVELHSGGQPGLPDCLALMLHGELYLAPFSFGEIRMLYKMPYCCDFREKEYPHGL